MAACAHTHAASRMGEERQIHGTRHGRTHIEQAMQTAPTRDTAATKSIAARPYRERILSFCSRCCYGRPQICKFDGWCSHGSTCSHGAAALACSMREEKGRRVPSIGSRKRGRGRRSERRWEVEAPVMEVTGDGKGRSGGGWRKMGSVWRAFGVRRSN